jgi:hypothetical protein
MALGETYEMDTRLITACDPSLGNISFDGIKTVSAFKPGSIKLEWDPATFDSYGEISPSICGKDLLLYDVYLAHAPIDHSFFTADELAKTCLGSQ